MKFKDKGKRKYFIPVLIVFLAFTTGSAFAHCCPGPCCASKPFSFQDAYLEASTRTLLKEAKAAEKSHDVKKLSVLYCALYHNQEQLQISIEKNKNELAKLNHKREIYSTLTKICCGVGGACLVVYVLLIIIIIIIIIIRRKSVSQFFSK